MWQYLCRFLCVMEDNNVFTGVTKKVLDFLELRKKIIKNLLSSGNFVKKSETVFYCSDRYGIKW